MKEPVSYKDAGVDIAKGEELVERIRKRVERTYGERVRAGVGGFASLYRMDDRRLLAAGCDGVGTKLLWAQKHGFHGAVGVDLVAMCVNDILCVGATPLFFLDYLATSALDLEIADRIISGIADGCSQSRAALIGGETAEMPGMYAPGEYDLAGFAVGEVFEESLLDGSRMRGGETLIGLPSSGPHSNGFSLLRKLFADDESEWIEKCMAPTVIYASVFSRLRDTLGGHLKGAAHITGGGVRNIPRMAPHLAYRLTAWPETPVRAFAHRRSINS